MQRYKKDIIQTNNLAKNDKIQGNNQLLDNITIRSTRLLVPASNIAFMYVIDDTVYFYQVVFISYSRYQLDLLNL